MLFSRHRVRLDLLGVSACGVLAQQVVGRTVGHIAQPVSRVGEESEEAPSLLDQDTLRC